MSLCLGSYQWSNHPDQYSETRIGLSGWSSSRRSRFSTELSLKLAVIRTASIRI